LLTSFFNGTDPNRLCFGYNSTDALNLIIFGLAFYLVFGVLRPLLRVLVTPPEIVPHAGGLGGVGQGEASAAYRGASEETYTDALGKVKEFTKSNPKVTADIVKEWMNKE
jgi:flagellar M-ring protein FliF